MEDRRIVPFHHTAADRHSESSATCRLRSPTDRPPTDTGCPPDAKPPDAAAATAKRGHGQAAHMHWELGASNSD